MNSHRTFSNFTNVYSLSKTLRFELKPIGKTLEYIQINGIIKNDQDRATNYQKMKKIIDDFHKSFIEKALNNVRLSHLEKFEELYFSSPERKKEDSYKREFEKIQTVLRKEISKSFKTGEAAEIFSKIDKKELFTQLLDTWVDEKEDKNLVSEFKKFTTYFTGFHKNRKNMYTDKGNSTEIAYRLVHENLPRFLDNIKTFEKIKTVPEVYEKCNSLYKDIEQYLNILKIDDAFELKYFNNVLTQKQIDVYNLIIGGKTVEDGKKKIQGLNEFINLHNQTQDKKNKIPKLKILYKQILSDRDSVSFLPDAFEDDNEQTASKKVLDAINNYYLYNIIGFKPKDKEDDENVLEKIKQLLRDLVTFDLGKIYIRNDRAITDISQAVFEDWGVIKAALEYHYLSKILVGKKGLTIKQEADKQKYLKQAYFSIAEIETALITYKKEAEILNNLSEDSHPVAEYFFKHFKTKKKNEQDKEFDFIANINAKYSCIKGILNSEYPNDKKLNQDKKTIDDIKAFLDSLMEVLHFVKSLALPSDTTLEKDELFYNQFEVYFEQLQFLITLYNKVRNYATQKVYSTEKFKLNFENSHFLSGWATEYSTKGALIVKKDENYFLVIVDKKLDEEEVSFLKDNFQIKPAKRIVYDFQKPEYKNIPRLFIRSKGENYSPAVLKHNLPIDDIIEIYDKGYYKTEYRKINPKIYKESLIKLIDYFKEGFQKHESYKDFEFSWKETIEYENIDQFYNDVEVSCYRLREEEINFNHLLEFVDQGKLYLFRIYNKDFSSYSKGKPNMHTLYWKALFDEQNLQNVIYKLNGQAEVFYRKKSLDKITIHKANQPIENKNPKNPKKQSTFNYDLIKNKRYTVDKFQFHVPITINFKAKGNEYINNDVLTYLKENPDVNIIGIDRGERHLIYLTLINQKGEILQQESLNSIINKQYNIETPYHQLLQTKEDDRAKARENWGFIENIKELKEGYISQVVYKIARMMVENNAIVVMEDLNTGFKRGRFKVEKQVYQKLEKMLIDKLNYLVFKDFEPNQPGGIYNALQLTSKFKSFKEMGKQSGFLFYVPAWNTSKIDPTTGFVNLFSLKYENIEKTQEFFKKFDNIIYNKEKGYFEFQFDYNNFTSKAEGTRTRWTVCTYGDRIITFRNQQKNNQWDNEEVNLTEKFEEHFGKFNIIYGHGKCIREEICTQTDKVFLKGLLDLFKLTLQMRNSKTNSEIDYLISPVMNSTGNFYDSRKADDTLPKDADANGAYHIAKKGLLWLNQIKSFEGTDWKKLDFDKTNKGWLNFVQNSNC